MMDLAAYMEERRRRVDDFLQSHLSTSSHGGSPRLFEAMRYSLLAGGKRIRPLLTFAAYEACLPHEPHKSISEGAVAVGCAIEMIHTYSLIHDDLPAMDNDDLRRGRPTNHKVFGEAAAILAGDALLTEAFLVVAGVKWASPSVLVEIIGDIALASGGEGMAGGQALDLEAQGRKITPQELETLHRHKTGRLIKVSVTSGARLAGAEGEALRAIGNYGENIGLAFQIADDILDVEGGSGEMGKATGGDARKEKATYPSTFGLNESKRLAKDFGQKAVSALQGFGPQADALREIARYIVDRRS